MKVLLGVDGGEGSRRALDRTVGRVRETGDDLTVALLATEGADGETGDLDELEGDVRDVLESAAVDAAITHITEDPTSGFVDMGDSEDFDELVIGGGELSPMGKIRLGSFAEFVLLNARTTVTLVR